MRIIFIFYLCFCSSVFAAETGDKFPYYVKVSQKLMGHNLFYATIPYLKEALFIKDSSYNSAFDSVLEFNMRITGRTYFEDLTDKVLNKSNSPSLNFIRAQKLFFRGMYDDSLEIFSKIPAGHYLYLNTLFFKGSIFEINNVFPRAHELLKECVSVGSSADFKNISDKVSNEFIKDSCEISLARTLFKMDRSKYSSVIYNRIPIESFKWPDTLIEDSWNSYKANDFNRTIGKLFTYKAPFLKSYNFVESEILKVLSFVKLCLWDDAVDTINFYNNYFYSNAEKIQKNLPNMRSDFKYFAKLLDGNFDFNNEFLNNFLRGIKVRPQFMKFAFDFENLKREESKIEKISNKKLQAELLYNINEVRHILLRKFHSYIISELKFYLSEIFKGYQLLGKINLNIYSKKKRSIMKDAPMNLEDKDWIDIVRNSNQYYWGKIKEFWLDELGQYVYGIKSQCIKN